MKPDSGQVKVPFSGFSDLQKRILTAIVLAPAGVIVVLLGGLWLTAATAICAVIAAFEWSRMASPDKNIRSNLLAAVVLSIGGLLTSIFGNVGLISVVAFSLATAAIAFAIGMARSKIALSFGFGGLYVTFPFGAFVFIREHWDGGAIVLFSILILVWTTDFAAFLAGRGFGGPRIAPQKSPNKTWTGALGALICTVLAGAALSRVNQAHLVNACFVAGVISVVAQGGDLLESWFKRRFGVKDASGVIPGHGGVLDRLDSLMAVVSFVAVVGALAPGIAPN